ncbi:Zn-dependent hydrolase [Xylophilus sp. GOD-11R]|uniref:Zn-dependent hydrolase n=1 Tax=Xylophilus sp. GOD-11R TaxID=3089814 RepID=UPI00298BD413|nr:Zn-dependent hydrolase [Xylophilus sp. GOD-11R]WPB56677.1 Zn-dependent hydrolase [Xylophilus sp. GOD-11R]
MNLTELRPLAEKLFDDIRALSFDGVGVTRESYGAGETATADYLRAFAAAEGLYAEPDRAANIVFRQPNAPADAVAWTGSHIDSVPQGGNFDGLAGVVAGLLCLVDRQRAGSAAASLPLEVIAFRGEESAWFGKAYMGSGALLGKLGDADLALRQRATGQTLGDAMEASGADVAAIRAGQPLADLRRVKAYLELHIEQGPVMVARELPLAVVSGIRGNVRHNRIVCRGDAQHSGVVPRWLRRDAMFAVADLIMRIDEHWRVLLERGTDLVVTTGIVGTDPAEHSISRIPGSVAFSLEARSRSQDTLEAFYQLVRAECSAVSRERGVRFEFDRRLDSDPASMDPVLCASLARACAAQGTVFDTIASGAGHDASLFANAGVPAGMLFVRNRNGSHNPHEAMEIDDFMLGVQALGATLAGIGGSHD